MRSCYCALLSCHLGGRTSWKYGGLLLLLARRWLQGAILAWVGVDVYGSTDD